MVASSTTISWAVAMTSRARPRRRLLPAAVAPAEPVHPVADPSEDISGRAYRAGAGAATAEAKSGSTPICASMEFTLT